MTATARSRPGTHVLKHLSRPEEFQRFAEASPDGIAVIENLRYIYANAAWARALEEPRESLVGRSILDHVASEDRASVEEWLAEQNDEADRTVAEYRFASADSGSASPLLQLSRVRLEGEGGRHRLGLIARNVTRMKQTQAKLLLADRMMSIGALAAGTAHEINNPLTYVQGNVSFALEELASTGTEQPLDEETYADLLEALREAQEGAERVRIIVRRLQAFARADQETQRRVDLNRVVEEAVNMAFTEFRHRARLRKELGESVVVYGNAARLGQVVLNLLLNAAHALPEGRADENFIRVASRREDGEAVVEVQDSGPGIPPEIVGRVFDSLFTTKPVGVGTGLGLSIAHSIVNDLGGRIRVESELGKGTTFSVVFKAEEGGADATSDLPSSDEEESEQRARILVVDDEPLISAALKRALREHFVEVASSGRDAVQIIEAKQGGFDLVFCDLMMPDLTGMDVYEWTKARHPRLERSFVFMTGGIFTPRAQTFLQQIKGSAPTLEKPFDLDRVRGFVRDELGRRRRQASDSRPPSDRESDASPEFKRSDDDT